MCTPQRIRRQRKKKKKKKREGIKDACRTEDIQGYHCAYWQWKQIEEPRKKRRSEKLRVNWRTMVIRSFSNVIRHVAASISFHWLSIQFVDERLLPFCTDAPPSRVHSRRNVLQRAPKITANAASAESAAHMEADHSRHPFAIDDCHYFQRLFYRWLVRIDKNSSIGKETSHADPSPRRRTTAEDQTKG